MISRVIGELLATVPLPSEHVITIDWMEWLKVTGSFTAIALAAVFIFQPVFDRAVFNAWRRKAADVRKALDELYEKEIAAQRVTAVQSSANADALEFIKASVLQQGKILPAVSDGLARVGDAVERLTTVVDRVDERSHDTSGVAAHVAGQVEMLLRQNGLPVTPYVGVEHRDPEQRGGRRVLDKLNPVTALVAEAQQQGDEHVA